MKKVLLILLPLLLLGTPIGLHFAGILRLPFLPAPKKAAKAMYGEKKDDKVAKAPAKPKANATASAAAPRPPAAPRTAPRVPTDPEQGAKQLAKVWSRMPPETLARVVESWNPEELVVVLVKMDGKRTAALLEAMAKPEERPKIEMPPLPPKATDEEKLAQEQERLRLEAAQKAEYDRKDAERARRVANLSRALQREASRIRVAQNSP